MTRGFRRSLLAILGLGVGALCLWLAMRGVDWRDVARIFGIADPSLIALAIALHGTAMLMRTARWRGLVAFRAAIGLGVTLKALLVGYAINSILPARLGEVFRADFMARQTGLSRAGVLASIFVERLLDLIVVVGLLAAGLAVVGGGSPAVLHVLVLGTVAAVAVGCGLYFVGARLSEDRAEAFFAALLGRLPGGRPVAQLLASRIGDFAQLLRSLRGTRFAKVAALTLPIWAVETLAIWFVCRALKIDLAPGAMLCLMGAANLSTLMPTAPVYAGSYQLAYVVVLAEFGIGATSAIAASAAAQLYLIGGFTLLGLVTLTMTIVVAAYAGRVRPP